ncbi:hypothetical protein GLOIN_2v1071133 [Rhizophagus irregularis DAOM 181602=DAOM 197198]|uniref:Uncharacterized protein n=1 Tax=Rhizophagus irregularis (strain DAOM 181602 / DAOM 197198 / MUCL 43194) TaxID=747089 RepID=A0A2P4NPX3_RHIID|nr:hypothetical protein GLOIN_2v1071133 [Rhizophagus irregularis DAOM 181602=DAOM 197198]POG55183.1 hypothetical protein GLOIN_2v1071133 [Rhizophagus irregularis DAOM 181602=DAOM 197198]GET60660.1 hypothetical protein GLOIN_2v1071133 [Rhizophagus irregularis DAOM 181602=DAOM 197198]|eukprot:XP_025164271.1 hypothetical protein GLOIN_2v1071133 [Rhizophagus irregularis DAOM 181602=DAOM 197198]
MAPRSGYGIPLFRWYSTNDKYVNIEINNKKFIVELEKFKNKTSNRKNRLQKLYFIKVFISDNIGKNYKLFGVIMNSMIYQILM